MAIEKRFIQRVEFLTDFAYVSTSMGYGKQELGRMNFTLGERLIDTVTRLAETAEERNFFEIYTENNEQGWGRLKATDSLREDGRARAGLGFYAGFFHGRVVAGKHDPLVVVSFRGEIVPPPAGYDSAYVVAVIHAVTDHTILFAEGDDKYDESHMRDLRQQNSNALKYLGSIPDDEQPE